MSIVNEMEDLLQSERKLLLEGKLEALGDLVERKTKLVERLSTQKPTVPAGDMRRLLRRASLNDTLLEAARRGLQTAIQQLRTPGDVGEQNTYSRNGERQPLSRRPSSVIQKI